MPQLNYLYTNPAWEHLLLMESHVMEVKRLVIARWESVGVNLDEKGKQKTRS